MANDERTNHAWIIAKACRGKYTPDCLRLEPRSIAGLLPGQLLLRTIYLSLDPTSRNWLKLEPSSNIFGLAPGSVMIGHTICQVEESATEGFAKGDLVVGMSGWERYSTVQAAMVSKVKVGVPLETNTTIFSHIGYAAATGMIGVGDVQSRDTVVVSAAAGATGSIAAQIAKARGAHVIGIAGGAEKCRFLIEELGLDGAIDYKTQDVATALAGLCPQGVSLFFDNVGGRILDAVLMNLAIGARIAVCGQIALYDSEDRHDGQGVRNLMELVFRQARMEGFVAGQQVDHVPEFDALLERLYREGKIGSRAHIVKGLEKAAETLPLVLSGENKGKLMIEVSPPPTKLGITQGNGLPGA